MSLTPPNITPSSSRSTASIVVHPHDTPNPIISINVSAQAPLKLTTTNYTAWRLQFHTLFVGYDLLRFIDGTHLCPSPTIQRDGISTPNPAYSHWVTQDQLILNVLIRSLSPTFIPFIATVKISHDVWSTLANTYAKPSRGCIMQLKSYLNNLVKGTKSITEYMQAVKTTMDALILMNVPVDAEYITLNILNGLDDSYRELSNAIQARETSISFEELHDKLINQEAELATQKNSQTSIPTTAFTAARSVSSTRQSRSQPCQLALSRDN